MDAPKRAYSVAEFCAAHDISRGTFYNLLRAGSGPKTMTVGRRRLVTDEAAAAWRTRPEAATSPSEFARVLQPATKSTGANRTGHIAKSNTAAKRGRR
jgi:predicted DNA-binding transcriptional regulator AlpA